jgi:hypothetical protein
MPWAIQVFVKLQNILRNDAKELTPYKFEFQPEANKIKKYFDYAHILIWISRTNDRSINQLCHAISL